MVTEITGSSVIFLFIFEHFFFINFQENEQFKKLEARRLAREKKAAEEKARKEKLGITDEPKVKKGKIPPPKEEKCIIDNLLDEVKNGFPLRKLNMDNAPGGKNAKKKEEPGEKKKSGKWSKVQLEKSRALASFLGNIFYFDFGRIGEVDCKFQRR